MDDLEGTKVKNEFLKNYDENGDGIISYEEFGKKGTISVYLYVSGNYVSSMGKEELGYLKGYFELISRMFKYSDKKYNTSNDDATQDFLFTSACSAALAISELNMELRIYLYLVSNVAKVNGQVFNLRNSF